MHACNPSTNEGEAGKKERRKLSGRIICVHEALDSMPSYTHTQTHIHTHTRHTHTTHLFTQTHSLTTHTLYSYTTHTFPHIQTHKRKKGPTDNLAARWRELTELFSECVYNALQLVAPSGIPFLYCSLLVFVFIKGESSLIPDVWVVSYVIW